ncbi:MAG: HlyD family efflux transporter periplasmic adaptor subunit [Prolixibacteraceae bacterium]|nr:HlyD family efflux transporter periplasmic adaptor subunit [Prolixibacteraceae bacterium]
MQNIITYFILIIIILSGCNGKKVSIITYDLKRTDYVESIDATGAVQAVNNFTVMSPRVNASSMTVAYLAKEGAHVKRGDTVCILEAPDLVYGLENLNIDLEKMEADMKKLVADNAMEKAVLKAQVETNKAQIAISMLDSIQLKFVPAVKQELISLDMERAQVEKKKLQKKVIAQARIDNSEIMQLKSRLMMQKNRIKVFQDQINSLTLVSPGDGIVIHYESPLRMFMGNGVGTFGGKIEEKSSVFSNMPVLQFPDMKEMQVSVEVPEAEYKRIQNNQKVLIRVDASANLNTTGKIKRKSLAGKVQAEKPTVKSYEVIVSVDSCHLKMQPGLSASCRIVVDQVKDTIVVPSVAIFRKDSLKIVYVAGNGKFTPVVIETGLSNNSKSIISKGLSGNETIALMEPPYDLVTKVEQFKASNNSGSVIQKHDSIQIKSTVRE